MNAPDENQGASGDDPGGSDYHNSHTPAASHDCTQ
jgi:hypothetical protein